VKLTKARWAAALAAAVAVCFLSTAERAEASLARKLGQPISAYSASLFGKTNLTALQTQTLTCDPDQPLGGSTSTTYDPTIVRVSGYGRGPGYLAGNADSPFPSGAGVEIVDAASPNGKALVDLEQYLNPPIGKPLLLETGYLRFYFAVTGEGVGSTGKLTDDFNFTNVTHPGLTPLGSDGPVGVDTHYYDFTYLQPEDARPAGYSVFAELADKHYVRSPDNPSIYNLLASDFVVTQDAPTEQLRPGGEIPFVAASVSGSVVPEPAGVTLLLGAAGLTTLARKRRRA
jgi:hypothetical protein